MKALIILLSLFLLSFGITNEEKWVKSQMIDGINQAGDEREVKITASHLGDEWQTLVIKYDFDVDPCAFRVQVEKMEYHRMMLPLFKRAGFKYLRYRTLQGECDKIKL